MPAMSAAWPVRSSRHPPAVAARQAGHPGYDASMATLEDLEARVAALEASQADYRAVLTAVNALGANQRELAEGQRQLKSDVADLKSDAANLKSQMADTNTRVRSLEDGQAEIKDLLIRALDK